jgi:hypothetical protein
LFINQSYARHQELEVIRCQRDECMQEMQEMREELANMKTMLKKKMDRIEVKFDKIVDMVSRQCEFVVFFFFFLPPIDL